MKLATFFLAPVFSYGGLKGNGITDERGLTDERYIYEQPFCSSVSQCAELEGINKIYIIIIRFFECLRKIS